MYVSVLLTLRIMQMTAFLLVACCITVSAETRGQNNITYCGRDVKLTTVLEAVQKQTGYLFIYDNQLLINARPVTIQANNIPLADFMELALKGQQLTWVLQKTTILILKKNSEQKINEQNADPPITVKGKVINENAEPVVASIMIKGTTQGATSDAEGFFTLNNVDEQAVLVISGIGIETQEIKVAGKSEIFISAKTRISEEEEVTVKTNYYSTSKRLSTGNIAKITSKEIGNQPVTSPLLALQGRVAGMEISSPASAVPGTAPGIRIRGNNSLRMYGKRTAANNGLEGDGNYPLYIIDGVPVNSAPVTSWSGGGAAGFPSFTSISGYDPLSTINPANIESIEILKDGEATAIYGSRGANGVILITTKQATKSESGTNADVSVYRGIGKITNRLDLLNTEQYLAMRKEALANDGITPDNLLIVDLLYWDQARFTDWQDVFLGGHSDITDIQGTISSSNKNTSFLAGGGFHKETLITPGDFGYYRATGNVSINHVSNDRRFKFTVSANYGFDNNKLFAGGEGIVYQALTLAPNAPKLYNEDGSLNWEMHDVGGGLIANTWTNPASYFRNAQTTTNRNLVASTNLSYEIFSGLSVSTNLGYTDFISKENIIFPQSAAVPNNAIKGAATFNSTDRGLWIAEPKISYSKNIKQHGLDLVMGSTWRESHDSKTVIAGQNYESDALLNSLLGAGLIRVIYEDASNYKTTSVYGRISYNWDQKYLFNLTGRRDGSSRFGPGKQFGNFGAVGAGWIFSEEKFLEQKIHHLSFGKIRASYGITGNDAIGDYRFYNLYNALVERYQGVQGLLPNGLYNADFGWEETKKLEAGLELAFLDNKFGIELSWYRNRSSNQLVEYTLPATTGFPSVLSNFKQATVQNAGWEIVLQGRPFTGSNWRWNISFNLSVPRNKLVRFDGIENSPYANDFKVGQPLSIQWLYMFNGVNPQTGLFEFADQNKDGVITEADRRLMLPMDRKYYGGLNNIVQFKGFELSILIQFSNQPGIRYLPGMPGRRGLNQSQEVLGRWFTAGDETDIQRFSTGGIAGDNYVKAQLSSYNIQDASFIRVKALSLSYLLPVIWTKKIALQQAKLFFQGQNLYTFTKYDGLDPETGNGLPPLRMLTGGIQIRL
jgi:TonB-linked SusC/RagA family outer membrane protein